jgi:hypothetical protein
MAAAVRQGWRIGEVPSRWVDRTAGTSNFKLWRWLPKYLRWYGRVLSGMITSRASS